MLCSEKKYDYIMSSSRYCSKTGDIAKPILPSIFLLCCSDTICDLGGVDELANYGEYSGAPSEQQTYDYAKTILSLMTREKHRDGRQTSSVHRLPF